MDKQKEFGQGIFFTISNYIYWFIVMNIYFVFANIIFLIAFMTLEPVISNLILIFLSLIPTGPAITALCYVMDKLVKEKEISPTKDFLYAYKLNFKDSLKVWLPLLAVIYILIMDLQYFYQENTTLHQILATICLAAMILLICVLLYVFPITAKFTFRVRDIYRLSIYYSFKRLKITTGNIGIIFIALFLMSITTDIFLLLFASILCYLLTLNSREVIEDIQAVFTK